VTLPIIKYLDSICESQDAFRNITLTTVV